MDAFEPECREIAARCVDSLLGREEVEFSGDLAQPFAVQVQCAFLGWPPHMHEPLYHWTLKNHGATFAQDRVALAEIAREFEGYVDELLQSRSASHSTGLPPIATAVCSASLEPFV